MTRRPPPPWPLLHISELEDACEGCGRHATRTASVGTRWCARCWDEAAARARGGRT
jgi:hypothetical protein